MTSLKSTISGEQEESEDDFSSISIVKVFDRIDLIVSNSEVCDKSKDIVKMIVVIIDVITLTSMKKLTESTLTTLTTTYAIAQTEINFLNHSFL